MVKQLSLYQPKHHRNVAFMRDKLLKYDLDAFSPQRFSSVSSSSLWTDICYAVQTRPVTAKQCLSKAQQINLCTVNAEMTEKQRLHTTSEGLSKLQQSN